MAGAADFVVSITLKALDQASPVLGGVIRNVGDAGSAVTKAGADLAATGARMSLAGDAIVGGLTALAIHASEGGRALHDMAARTGASVERLSALGYAARMTGTDLGAVEVGMKMVAKTAYAASGASDAGAKATRDYNIALRELNLEAAKGDMTQAEYAVKLDKITAELADGQEATKGAAEAYKTLGISVTDAKGQLKTTEELFTEVGNALRNVPDPATRAALAVAIFGRSGTQLIPMFTDAKKSVSEFTAEAERLGLVTSTKTANAMDEFRDKLDTLKESGSKVFNALGAAAVPFLTQLIELVQPIVTWLVQWIKAHSDLSGTAVMVVGSLALLVGGVGKVLTVVGGAVEGWTALVGLFSRGAVAANAAANAVGGVGAAAQVAAPGMQVAATWGQSMSLMFARLGTGATTAAMGTNTATTAIGALRAMMAGWQTSLVAMLGPAGVIALVVLAIAALAYELYKLTQSWNTTRLAQEASTKSLQEGIAAEEKAAEARGQGTRAKAFARERKTVRPTWEQRVRGAITPGISAQQIAEQEAWAEQPSTLARAAGGPVKRGQPYLVGEEGPEMFRPEEDGEIVAGDGGKREVASGKRQEKRRRERREEEVGKYMPIGTYMPIRATGGPVKQGQPYLVGDAGPELYLPAGLTEAMEQIDLGGALGKARNPEAQFAWPGKGNGGLESPPHPEGQDWEGQVARRIGAGDGLKARPTQQEEWASWQEAAGAGGIGLGGGMGGPTGAAARIGADTASGAGRGIGGFSAGQVDDVAAVMGAEMERIVAARTGGGGTGGFGEQTLGLETARRDPMAAYAFAQRENPEGFGQVSYDQFREQIGAGGEGGGDRGRRRAESPSYAAGGEGRGRGGDTYNYTIQFTGAVNGESSLRRIVRDVVEETLQAQQFRGSAGALSTG